MPVNLQTVFDALMYEYAKLIADRAIEERGGREAATRTGAAYWGFVNRTFTKLRKSEIQASSILRENKLFITQGEECAYCGKRGSLHWEHLIPLSRGGPDNIDNLVLACPACNLSKSAMNPVEWYAAGHRDRKQIPRLVMGKLIKLALERHRALGTLQDAEFPPGAGLHFANMLLAFEAP
jgi:CRISPR/Cas system Type II protein with McrA/HNH and RuvC-like nuclease domain